MNCGAFLKPAKRWAGVALAAAWLCSGSISAACAQTAAQTNDALQTYRVGPGDQLQVTVFGQDKLSGKFRVGPDGAISFPLIGNIAVANMTTDEIGKRLENGLASRLPAGLSPSVEIFEYAPVFVVGDVEKAGPYQYRPGMIALELMALAGGTLKPRDVDDKIMQMATYEQELSDQRILRFSQLAQRARLLAELAGSNSDYRPPSSGDDDLVSADARRRIIADQVSLYKVHQNVIADQARALGGQRASYDQEMTSLRESIALHDQEVKLLEQQVQTEEGLNIKGLALTSKVLDLKRELSATKRNALDIRLALARARQRQLEIDEKVVQLRDVQSKDDAKELGDVDVLLARAEEKIATTQTLIARLREASLKSKRQQRIEPIYTVVRSDAGRPVEQPVKAFDQLQPRDILRIERPDLTNPAEASN
jgi:polysaccharide export outer membrane protein